MSFNNSTMKFIGVLVLLCVLCPLASSTDCKKSPPRVNPKACCKMPELITKELAEKCKSLIPEPSTSASSESSDSDESKHRHHHKRDMIACFTSCVLKEAGILNEPGNKINEEKLSEYLKTVLANDAEMIPVLEKSFKTCVAKSEEMRSKYQEMMEKKGTDATKIARPPSRCPRYAERLMGCVFIENFINCPANKWTDSSECNEKRDFMKNCWPRMMIKGKPENASSE